MWSLFPFVVIGFAGIVIFTVYLLQAIPMRSSEASPTKKVRTKTEIGDEWRKQFDACDDLKRKIGAIDHLLEQLDTPLDGYEYWQRLVAFRSPYVLVHELGILDKRDPLLRWMWATALVPEHMMPAPVTDWGSLTDSRAATLVEVVGRQCGHWKAQRAVLQSQHRDEASRLSALAQELGLEPAPGKASKREELKQLRVRVKEVEDEILEEENRNASGPERLKHGVHTDD